MFSDFLLSNLFFVSNMVFTFLSISGDLSTISFNLDRLSLEPYVSLRSVWPSLSSSTSVIFSVTFGISEIFEYWFAMAVHLLCCAVNTSLIWAQLPVAPSQARL